MGNGRTELQNEVARALVDSKAIDFEAVGNVVAKYAARAAVTGDKFGVLVGPHIFDACIPPFYLEKVVVVSRPVLAEPGVE